MKDLIGVNVCRNARSEAPRWPLPSPESNCSKWTTSAAFPDRSGNSDRCVVAPAHPFTQTRRFATVTCFTPLWRSRTLGQTVCPFFQMWLLLHGGGARPGGHLQRRPHHLLTQTGGALLPGLRQHFIPQGLPAPVKTETGEGLKDWHVTRRLRQVVAEPALRFCRRTELRRRLDGTAQFLVSYYWAILGGTSTRFTKITSKQRRRAAVPHFAIDTVLVEVRWRPPDGITSMNILNLKESNNDESTECKVRGFFSGPVLLQWACPQTLVHVDPGLFTGHKTLRLFFLV